VSLFSQPMAAMAALIRAAVGAALAGCLLLGTPLLLLRSVGNPFPSVIPAWDDVSFALTTGQIESQVWIKALALVAWAAWANLAIGFGLEVLAAARGGTAATVRGFQAARWLAARLIAQWALAGSLIFHSTAGTVAASLPAMPVPMPAMMVDDAGAELTLVRALSRPGWSDAGGSEIEIGRRDTLWALAETYLGDGGRWGELRQANIGRTMPDGTVLDAGFTRLRQGWTLVVPAAEPELGAGPADSAGYLPAAAVQIEPGDNLWSLSERRLEELAPDPAAHSVIRYVDRVVARNDAEIDDPDLIFPGQVFTFPQLGEQPTGPEPTVPLAPDDATVPGDVAGAEGPDQPPTTGAWMLDGPSQPPGPDRAAATAASDNGASTAGEQSSRLTQLGHRSGPVVLGAASGLLAAGALQALRRRRRYRLAHRSPGAIPAPPGPELDAIDRAIHWEADPMTRRWLNRAFVSLAARPIWEGETVAQPVLAQLSDDHLEIEFSAPDPVGAPIPWSSPDDGFHWRLARAGSHRDVPVEEAGNPAPTMVTVGAGTFLNLEAVGVLGVAGSGDGPVALVRSIVHELATSPSAGTLDIRSTIPLDGVDAHGLVQTQAPETLVAELVPWLEDTGQQMQVALSANAYAHRLRPAGEPIAPVVVVTDRTGLAQMAPLAQYAADRSFPLAVVAIGVESEAGFSIEVEGHTARVLPWDLAIEAQGLTSEVAKQLGEVLAQAASVGEEPLQAGAQVLAPVTGIQHREAGGEPAIFIRVLGEVEAEGASPLTSQQLSLLCFLACNGPSSRTAIVEALWDGQVISQSRFLNLLAETRARIGRNHFPEVRDGRYGLRGVSTDLAWFERELAEARFQDPPGAAARLRSGLQLVRGVPFTPPASRFWSWVGDTTHYAARIEATVADTAARLAQLELEAGDLDGARWACEKGLLASPTDEVLVTQLTEIYMRMAKPSSARRLVESWEDRISRMECGEPSDEPRKRLAG
jgi:DNA-binding SARP family transcriptional activator